MKPKRERYTLAFDDFVGSWYYGDVAWDMPPTK
jgi:hypothetical protein